MIKPTALFCALLLTINIGINSSEAFQISTYSLATNGTFQVQYPANTNSYYVLYRGTNITNIHSTISIAAGTNLTGSLADTNLIGPDVYYRVREIPNTQLPLVVSLIPPAPFVGPGGTLHFTVNLDIPAPPGGTVVSLALSPTNAGVIPPTVSVPAGTTSANFNYVDASLFSNITATATLGASSATSSILVTTTSALVINEIDYDQVGTDTAEFVEVLNGTSDTVNLAGLALVFINGANSLEYLRVNLSGTLYSGQYLVVCSTNVIPAAGAAVINFTNSTDAVQNGSPDGVALFNLGTHLIMDKLSYEGSITNAVINGEAGVFNLVEGTVLTNTVADNNVRTGSLIRYPNGMDTDNANHDWQFTSTLTPGAANILTP